MKIALYKYVKHSFETVFEQSKHVDADLERVRMTEFQDVEFKRLSQADTVNAELAVIDRIQQNVLAECQLRLNELEERRQSLLAITHDRAE